jgi:leucyl aminopeptidase
MKVSVTTIPLEELDVDILLIPCAEDQRDELVEKLAELDPVAVDARRDFRGTLGDAVVVYPGALRATRLGLFGLGRESAVTAETLRKGAATAAGVASKCRADTVAIAIPESDVDDEAASQALVEGFLLESYRFDRYRTEKRDDYEGPQRLVVHAAGNDKASRRGAERGRVVSEAVCTARDLVNLSPDEKTPQLLAREIEKLGKKHGFDASTWDQALIEEEGMGGLLAVNRGSTEPPTFTVIEWRPDSAANDRPVVLVGKGVVFDTGGLSLKPTKDSMDAMKSDMAGAAAVVGAMEAIARLELPLYVVALIPATDNRPGENAYVPGDVVKMHSGATVEVLNTDAEGRMLLADALSYAKTYKPQLVIDVATLTGAAVVALGSEVAAVMTNDDEGASERLELVLGAASRSGDMVHQLPMYEHYGDLLKSDVADMKNVGGREAGSITAGKFLERFTAYPWIHLDIAGPSFLRTAKPYRPVGGTGFGVRLLVEVLREISARSSR